jgi:acetolactate synthase-1/2/3 large subunit
MARSLTSQEIAATALVDGLADGGVSIAFGLDDPRGFFAAARRSSRMRVAIIHDERTGGFMADAFARVTGRPAACSGISGPGAVNLAPALLEAYRSDIPMVAVIGEFLPPRPGLRAFQEAPHASFLGAGLTKAIVEVRELDELYTGALEAARLATSGRPGPVLLLISDQLLWQPLATATAPRADGPLLGARQRADANALAAARDLLVAAERPMILAGAAVNGAGAHAALLDLAVRIGAPVATSMSGKGAIAETHELALGVTGAYTSGVGSRGSIPQRELAAADAILVVGSDLDALTTDGWCWPADGAHLIRIDIDEGELAGHAGLHLHGDALEVLLQLLDQPWPAVGDVRRARCDALGAEVAANDDRQRTDDLAVDRPGAVWPGALIQEVGSRLEAADYVVTDASYSSSWALDRIVQRRAGRQVIAPRGVGTLGWGVAAAMGVKLAQPDARVTCISGDGALFYGLPEMETAARWNLDFEVVVLDNGVYGSQRLSNLLAQGQDYQDLHFTGALDRVALACALGWSAAHVTSLAEFAEVYERGRETPGPWLINVAVEPDSRPPLTKFDAARDG